MVIAPSRDRTFTLLFAYIAPGMTTTIAPHMSSPSAACPPGLVAGCARMRTARQPCEAIRAFKHYYNLLYQGASGLIHSRDAQPVPHLTDYTELEDFATTGHEKVGQALVLKLNGGLGTSMGLSQSKGLIPIRDDMTFLDFIVAQVAFLRRCLGAPVPLMFMNSFHSHASTLAALHTYHHLQNGMDLDFQQHQIPKLTSDTLVPVHWPTDPTKEWCPPGHGDVYSSLYTTGLLDTLMDRGYRYAFISNTDNLGAILDTRILGYMAAQRIPMLMEVAYRSASDRKGGHLAQDAAGRFLIREFAQCPEDELSHFQDIDTYRFFNTNNVWLYLPFLRQILQEHEGFLPLPPIFNRKPVDPSHPTSPMVIQMESAMGSAISLIPGASALRVPRTRFLPVKRCEDLLVIQSDVYQPISSFQLTPQVEHGPVVSLDPHYYSLYTDMQKRFPYGPPSLVQCRSLSIHGDVQFGRDVVLQGDVVIRNRSEQPYHIPDNTLIQGDLHV